MRCRYFLRLVFSCLYMCLAASPGAVLSAEEINVGGTGIALGTMQRLAEAFNAKNPGVVVKVLPSLGSGGGIKALLGGAIDLALSARPLKEEERAAGAQAVTYANTPYVFAVQSKNPATGVTKQDLVNFYSTAQSQWPDGKRVRLVLREANDHATLLVKSISPQISAALTQAEQRHGIVFVMSDQEAAREIEALDGGFGGTALALILSEKRALKPLNFEGVAPTVANLANGTYPFSSSLLMVTKTGKQKASVERFIKFVQSPAGAKILTELGHVLP